MVQNLLMKMILLLFGHLNVTFMLLEVFILTLRLLVLLLGVIFTIPAQSLSWDGLGLFTLSAFVVAGMIVSVAITSRRLSTLKVVEALREL